MSLPDKQILAASLCAYGVNTPDGVAGIPFAKDAGLDENAVIQTFVHGLADKDACYVAQITDDTLILAFRGTALAEHGDNSLQAVIDWINNFLAKPVSGSDINVPGLLHQGFKHSTVGLLQKAGVADYIGNHLKDGMSLIITGYSKGAALTPIAAAWLAENLDIDPARMQIRMFEPPRAGDEAFRTYFNQRFQNAVRYEYQDDIVPHVPPVKLFTDALINIPEVGKYLKKFENMEDWNYKAVGTLKFVNWKNEIVPYSDILFAERLAHIVKLLATEDRIKLLTDHMPCGHIYNVLFDEDNPIPCQDSKLNLNF